MSRAHRLGRALLALLAAAPTLAVAGRVDVVVRDANGAGRPNVVVYAIPEGGKVSVRPRPGSIDQIDKAFVPQIVVVQTGAPVSFPNKDNIRHHVYSFSPPKPFELKLYSGVPSKPVVFDKAGPVTLGCNIHDNMLGFIYVVDTPWFGKTDATGIVALDGLPAGRYQVHTWHPFQTVQSPAAGVVVPKDGGSSAAFQVDIGEAPRAAN